MRSFDFFKEFHEFLNRLADLEDDRYDIPVMVKLDGYNYEIERIDFSDAESDHPEDRVAVWIRLVE